MTGILNILAGSISSAIKDGYFNLVSLLLPGNGTNGAQNNTFIDSSTNNFTITRNGNTTQGTFSPFSQTGWGNYFDGSSYLSVADNTALQLGSSDFTWEGWFYITANVEQTLIYSCGNNTSYAGMRLSYDNATSKFILLVSTNGTNWSIIGNTFSTTAALNTWHHVAIVRSGTTFTVYQNGSSVYSTTLSGAVFGGTNHYIGAFNATGGGATGWNYFNGYASNVRLVKGTAVYTSNFTPSTTPLTAITNTSLLTCQANRFRDASSNAFTITVNGTPSVQAFSPFAPTAAYSASTNGGSGYFDGTGDYLSIADNAAFTMGTGDFTIEYWTYVPTLADMRSYGQCDSVPNVNTISFFGGINGSSKGYCGVRSGTTEYACTSTANFPRNQWVHHALVRDGTTLRQYINGVQDGTSSVGSASVNDSSFQLAIGRLGEFNAYNWNGYISSFRITKGGCLYPSGTTFTPPTTPFTTTVSSGTVSLLANFTNAGITDATAKNDLETVGNAQISTTQSKFGGSSIYFDGTGDYAITPLSSNLDIFSSNFTIEFWVYFNSVANSPHILQIGKDEPNRAVILLSSSKLSLGSKAGGTGGTKITGTTTITTGQWYYVALVRSSNTVTLYLNGSSEGSYTAADLPAGNLQVAVGWQPYGGAAGDYTNAYIDDLRITRGFARYTTTFTPPTQAFALQ